MRKYGLTLLAGVLCACSALKFGHTHRTRLGVCLRNRLSVCMMGICIQYSFVSVKVCLEAYESCLWRKCCS